MAAVPGQPDASVFPLLLELGRVTPGGCAPGKSRDRSFHSLESEKGQSGGRGLCHAENRGHLASVFRQWE